MQKTALCCALALTMVACTSVPMMAATMGDYRLMKGAGSVARAPDGTTSFNWVIHKDAFEWLSQEETGGQSEEGMRLGMLSKWIGEKNICPNGYDVAQAYNDRSTNMLIYEGRCK